MNEDYGRIIPVEGGAEPIDPSLRYRVVFAVTKPIGDGGAPHHDLVRVARFLTLLADAGVSIEADDVLAIVSGPATSIVTLGDAVNRPLIEQLVRSEEHTSELQSLMRISYAVLCLKKKKIHHTS